MLQVCLAVWYSICGWSPGVLVHFLSVNLENSRPVYPLEGHLVNFITVFTMGKSELCLVTTLDILMVHFEIFILK